MAIIYFLLIYLASIIGDGLFNIVILALGFSMNAKDPIINSIFIFFSDLDSLLIAGNTTLFVDYDLSILVYIIVGGIIGDSLVVISFCNLILIVGFILNI